MLFFKYFNFGSLFDVYLTRVVNVIIAIKFTSKQ